MAWYFHDIFRVNIFTIKHKTGQYHDIKVILEPYLTTSCPVLASVNYFPHHFSVRKKFYEDILIL